MLDFLNSTKPDIIHHGGIRKVRNCGTRPQTKKQQKNKDLQFSVNYKCTHTNMNFDAWSNYPKIIKKAIMKGFGDRVRSVCDKDTLQGELQIQNKFNRKLIQKRKD